MGFDLRIFEDDGLDAGFLEWLTRERAEEAARHFGRMWDYYANPMVESTAAASKSGEAGRCYVQAQEAGLPARITGILRNPSSGLFGGRSIGQIQRKEVVIENDIAWRINAAVDFLFGKPITIVSKSPDAQKRAEIETIIKLVFGANGGIGFFQDMAVLGGVYGFVDCFVRPGEEIYKNFTSQSHQSSPLEAVLHIAQTIELELIEAPRALPILDENNYKRILYYVQHFYLKRNEIKRRNTFLARLLGQEASGGCQTSAVTEIVSAKAWQRYEDGEFKGEGENLWGFVPVVHIQNLAQPFYYEGISDVEPLIPLQDELNTRLSDRANRITMQSFKMYLGKGIEGFEDKPISPGRMWCTDNPEATIEEFGGDEGSASEDIHIDQIREALDKTSSVTPIVAGVIGGKIGNLTSAVALKLMLMGMLSKTERKKFTYSEGIKKICAMVLAILDRAGIYKTNEEERGVEVVFGNPLPENMLEKLQEAQIKKELGVPGEEILKELGY